MRYFKLWFLLFYLLIAFSCQTSHEEGSEIHHNAPSESPLPRQEWLALHDLEKQILAQPTNTNLIKQLLKLSVDSARGFIHVVGFSIITPSNLTSGLQLKLGEQAAFMEAQRWAMSIQHWLATSPGEWRLGEIAERQNLPVHFKSVSTSRDTVYVFVTFIMDQAPPLSEK